ncbi:MAG: hypothetical protein ACFFBD_20390 [Candidatus Hodarchaeota archaeon]
MNLAITSGGLSYPDIQVDKTEWVQIGQKLKEIAHNYDILTFNPEHQEILLKIKDLTTFNSEIIRGFLKLLQIQTHRSFVALVNMSNQCILITVRG